MLVRHVDTLPRAEVERLWLARRCRKPSNGEASREREAVDAEAMEEPGAEACVPEQRRQEVARGRRLAARECEAVGPAQRRVHRRRRGRRAGYAALGRRVGALDPCDDRLLETLRRRARGAERLPRTTVLARQREQQVLLADPVVTESPRLVEGAGVTGVGLQSDTSIATAAS